MNYSAANTGLWNVVIQVGLIAIVIMVTVFLRSKLEFIRRSLMPVAVLAGFLLLILKLLRIAPVDDEFMEMLVYHGIALGFIAMSLRVPEAGQKEKGGRIGLRSGAIIVSSYLVQAITGLIATLALSYTIRPDLFKASGLLLPMGYGQGPGQANNVGSTYEALGFGGGRSFGLAIAAAGFIVACVVGVVIINILARQGKIRSSEGGSEAPTIDFFQANDEIPVSDSIDKLSVQIALVMITYLATYLISWGITSGLASAAPGLAATLNTLIWGFNFIFGSAVAILVRVFLANGRKNGIFMRQYQNNYLLNRISGFFFDIMVVAGIASIRPSDIRGLWLPFALMVILGAVVTWFHLRYVCSKVYGGYYYEGLISMYGMMTGTISSGEIGRAHV